ncbi:MAG: TolC family protein [Saprospiraceae bacterium]
MIKSFAQASFDQRLPRLLAFLVLFVLCWQIGLAQVNSVLAKAPPSGEDPRAALETQQELQDIKRQNEAKAVQSSDTLNRSEMRSQLRIFGSENERPTAIDKQQSLLRVKGGSLQLPGGILLDTAMSWVLRKHPLAIAAKAVESRGPAALLGARGGFDPTVVGDFQRKEYVGTEYFNYADVGVTWQSPLALKIEAGHQWADGVYLNNERTVPDAGQAYVSLKLPVLQGLLTDKYRVGVKQGEVAVQRNKAAANIIRNELRYDVAVAYTNWSYAVQLLTIYEETEELIAVRLANTLGLYQQGDKPAVDTLEARVSLFNQQLTTQQARVDAQVAEQELRAIYWELPDGSLPSEEALNTVIPESLGSVTSNPELAELRASFADLQLERQLKREYLKPKLDLSYSLLGDGFDLTPADGDTGVGNLFTSAYKFGATFSYPILNRTAKANVQMADIKLAETGAKLEAKRQSLVTKADAYSRAAAAYDAQLQDVTALAAQAAQLLQFERELFDLGESTQFLLNSREQSLQKALLTRAKLKAIRAKAIWSWRKAVGNWQ